MSTSKDGHVKIITKENSSEFQSWELPNVGFNDENSAEADLTSPMITAEELEDIHQQAYTEGYDEGKLRGIKDGFEQGEEEGRKQGKKQAFEQTSKDIEEKIQHFENIFLALEKPLSQTNEQVEYEMMQLAFYIAKHIIKQEIKMDPAYVIKLVKDALDLLPSASKNISLYLNPLDIVMVKEAFDLLGNKENNSVDNNLQLRFKNIRILADQNIHQGGCIVDTNISHMDASIEKRIEDLAKKIIPVDPSFEQNVEHSGVESPTAEKLNTSEEAEGDSEKAKQELENESE